MQNTSNLDYLEIKNIINIKSEVLFREAEDDFYYFSNLNIALKKLTKAIQLTPNHLKSIILAADILFMKGQFKKSLELYEKANKIQKNNARLTAAIANCYFSLQKYEMAIDTANKALKYIHLEDFYLFEQISELKINAYIELKNYKKALNEYKEANKYSFTNAFKDFYTSNFELLNEKITLQKKLNKIGLKIV